MPGKLDGAQLAEQLHRNEPSIPILFVTARPDVLARVRATGMKSATLPKPFSPGRLISAVSRILRSHQGNPTAQRFDPNGDEGSGVWRRFQSSNR
jgi:DNA-binding response OmpR family regulator